MFNGTFAIQLSAAPSKNTLTYSKQSLNGSSGVILNGAAEIKDCPEGLQS